LPSFYDDFEKKADDARASDVVAAAESREEGRLRKR